MAKNGKGDGPIIDDRENAKETNRLEQCHSLSTNIASTHWFHGRPLLIVITVWKKFNLALFAY